MLTNDIDILLVEDNKSDAKLIIRELQKHGFANNMIHLIDGAQALDFIFCKADYAARDFSNKQKVIFLDVKMPKVSGLEVLKIVKTDERTRLIPVVMMISSKEEKDIAESHRLGVNSYVVKPVGFENFSKTIADLGYYWLLINNTPK